MVKTLFHSEMQCVFFFCLLMLLLLLLRVYSTLITTYHDTHIYLLSVNSIDWRPHSTATLSHIGRQSAGTWK